MREAWEKELERRPRLAALCSLLLLAACGGKQIPPRDGIPSPHLGTIRDMRSFPQDLTVFAQQAGADTPLLDSQAQAEQDARFNRIFFGPWDMRKTSIRKRDVEIYFRKAKGYKYGDVRWTQDEWDAMRANAGLKSFPNTAMYGITVRNADLREMPSHTPRFSEPTPDPRINPFDYFQYSLLPVGTPVFIAHTSRDGNWYYVETPVAAGWVDANDIGIVDEAFEASYKTGSYVAVLRDNVPLPGSLAGQVNIGTVLPLAPSQSDNTRLAVLVPVKNGSRATVVTLTLAHEDAAIKPLPMTPAQVALIGNVMMGQRYGWGGMFGDRDCSALTRELLTPFGIWLPRNSLRTAYHAGRHEHQGKGKGHPARRRPLPDPGLAARAHHALCGALQGAARHLPQRLGRAHRRGRQRQRALRHRPCRGQLHHARQRTAQSVPHHHLW